MTDEQWIDLRTTFERPGVVDAMLRYYQANAGPLALLGLRATDATRNRVIPVPTLAVTGANDGCIDTRIFDHLFHEEDFPKGQRVARLANADHFMHQGAPEDAAALLVN
jgi:pimeloyl-ACP methyl ester carboxylesterase